MFLYSLCALELLTVLGTEKMAWGLFGDWGSCRTNHMGWGRSPHCPFVDLPLIQWCNSLVCVYSNTTEALLML